MKKRVIKREGFMDSMIVAGIPIAIIYWILDSILNIFFYNKYNVLAAIFGPEFYEIYTRVIVLCILLIFGSHAQSSINRLKKTRDALRKSEEEHRAFIENLNVGVYSCTINSSGRFSRANPAMAHICGHSSVEEFMHTTMADLFPLRENLDAFINEIREKGSVSGREILMKRRDGRRFWASCSATAKSDEQGKIKWIDGVVEDITDRKQAEEALRTSEEKYRQLVNCAPAGIYEVDLRTSTFIGVNDVMCELTGYSRQELMAMKCYELLTEDSRKPFFKTLVKLFRGQAVPAAGEYRIRTKSGAVLWVSINARYHYDLGKLKTATVVVHDISRLKQAEQEKHQLQYRLYRSQKMEAIGTLAGGVAHDFNNLLMGIQGHISLMLSGTDYMQPHFNQLLAIENYIKSATDLTNKLMGFAKGERFEKSTADLNAMAREQIQVFGKTRKDYTIKEDYETDLWAVEIDAVQIKQVLLNLIVNALQAMPTGGDLLVRTRNVVLEANGTKNPPVKNGQYVKFSITDTGVGMDKGTMQRVFEPFFTTKKMGAQKGIGLGLASAYGIVRNHGGHITVKSEVGKGSTFNVLLPASGKKITERTDTERTGIRKETILILDDEHEVLDVLERMLARLGFDVLRTGSGRHALEVFNQLCDDVSLVILDAKMADVGSRELSTEMKRIKPDIRILFSTDDGADGRGAEILDHAADGLLRKPFSLMQLSKVLEDTLGV